MRRTSFFVAAATVWLGNAALAALIAQPASAQRYAEEADDDIEELVVTARRREEALIDTPMSVSVVTGDLLEELNVARLDEIAHMTPGLLFDSTTNISGSNSSASVFIRGIGQTDFTLVTEPGVGIYIDDIYLTHSIGNVLDVLDVERIEVLKGPQGTLFGRNTIGGAIRVVTRKPQDELSASVSAVVGDYSRLDVKGHVNLPLGDNFGLRISGLTQTWDGYVDLTNSGNTTGDKDTTMFAVQANYSGGPLSLDLMFNVVADNSLGAPNVLLAAGGGAGNQGAAVDDSQQLGGHNLVLDNNGVPLRTSTLPTTQNSIAYRLAELTNSMPENWLWNSSRVPAGCSASNLDPCLVDSTDMNIGYGLDATTLGLTLQWQINDRLSLKAITSTRNLETDFGRDADHSPVPVVSVDSLIEVDSLSQELQLSGTSGDNLFWLAGFYYFSEDGFMDDDVRFNNFSLLSGGDMETESTSFFGQATFSVSDSLDLTLGLRQTDESKTFSMDDRHQVASFAGDAIYWRDPANTVAGTDYTFALSFRNPAAGSYRAVPGCGGSAQMFSCELTEDSLDSLISLAWKFQDDQMAYVSLSTGFKGGGFQQRNANLPELPVFTSEEASLTEFGYKGEFLDGRLRVSGAYFLTDYSDLQGAVTEGAGQGVSVTRNIGDASLSGIEASASWVPIDRLTLVGSIATLDGSWDSLTDTAVRAGVTLDDDLLRAPELQFSLSAAWEIPLSNGRLTPRVDWSYSDDMWNDAQNTPELKRVAYDIIDVSITWERTDLDLEVAAFIKNMLDDLYVTSGFVGTPSPGAPIEYVDGSVSRPMTFGIRVTKGF